jgi:para-aminobenzoate synthetase component 1
MPDEAPNEAPDERAPLVLELVPPPDPLDACERLAGLRNRIFLDSATPGTRLGRYSFVTADPIAVVESKGATAAVHDRLQGTSTPVEGDALAALRTLLAPHRAVPVAGLPPFQGGAAGYIGYDWGRTLETLPAPRFDDLDIPDLVLGVYDWVIAWDHAEGRAWLISTGMPETERGARLTRAAERATWVRERLTSESRESRIANREGRHGSREGHSCHPERSEGSHPLDHAPVRRGRRMRSFADAQDDGEEGAALPDSRSRAPSHLVTHGNFDPRLALRSSFTHDDYLAAVARVREYVLAGDIFQANLSQRFEAPLAESPWSLYRRLRHRNASPFAAFLDFPGVAVLSASPERFLLVRADGTVETRPIKGTRPRGLGPEHDAALGLALTESAKDRAENLMIVDLMRNDLSRVCAPGSVRVPELFALERYATVHHLVSTVVGELAAGADAFDLVRATFPGGSITGAPKVRAMEIIAELEPSERGVYCGSVGYFSVTGDADTSIAIRTAVALGNRVYFSAGGGIIADSDPEQEYRETLDKARGMISALKAVDSR